MEPLTPSKGKGVPVDHQADEPTDIAIPQAPWDASESTAAETPIPPPPHIARDEEAFLEPGTQLGEYRVERPIGEGGMGVVYAAVHPLIGKRAAVKVLKKELCRVAYNVERFVDEARVVNQIGHPNIVDVFAFGQTADGRSYFVMEWLKGESLRDRIERARLDLEEICAVIRPLARALEAAHEHGVIHRDLKPDNVFLIEVRGEVPLVKLLDFGIAKLAREEHRMERTATGAMVGTPQYIAPEQAKGYTIDHRADIYSLGGILFELLTGRPPFVADNAMEVVAKHLMEPPPRPSAFADVPAVIDDVVVAMLAKDPAARPTLADVAATFERASALERTHVNTPSIASIAPTGPESAIIEPPRPSSPLVETVDTNRLDMLERAGTASPTIEVTAVVPPLNNRTPRFIVLGGFVVVAAITVMFVVFRVTEAPPKRPAVAAAGPTLTPIEPAPVQTEIAPKIDTQPERELDNPPDKPDRVSTQRPGRPASPAKDSGKLLLMFEGLTRSAEILIDGKVERNNVTLSYGTHSVTVRARGYQTQRFTIEMAEPLVKRTVKMVPVVKAPPRPIDLGSDSDRDLMEPGQLKKNEP